MSLLSFWKNFGIEKIKEANPDANPEVELGVYDAVVTSQAGMAASLQSNIQNNANAPFSAFASGFLLDYGLFDRGLPPRQGETQAAVVATNVQPPVVATTLSKGTLFTSNANGGVYLLQNDTHYPDNMLVSTSLISQQEGEGYQLAQDSTLQTTDLAGILFSVNESSDGANAETDSQVRNRLLEDKQNPTGGDRPGQYVAWAIEAAPDVVTDVYTIPNLFQGTLTIGVFILVGTVDYNEIVLATGDVYSRTATQETITTVSNYIEAEKGVTSSFQAGSVVTYQPPEAIEIQVTLPEGVALDSTTTNFNGDGITVEDFIKQEFRRGVVSYPTGGTKDDSTMESNLLLSRLQQALDSSLSFYNGIYARLLVDRKILVDGLSQDIPVPYNELNVDGNAEVIYDILPVSITVTELP